MSFALDVANWSEESSEEMASTHKAIIFELFTSVILDTPVLEGRLRANWIISDNSAAGGTIKTKDKTGERTKKKISNFLVKFDGKKDFNVFLTNNLPYAHRIEYDGWSKTKAPAGMVRKNMIRIANNIEA